MRNRSELIARLSNALALVETVAIALRSFEEWPGLGSVCMALNEASAVLGRVHGEVDLFLNKGQR